MNIPTNKRSDRIFVLACGRSCDSVDFLPFLKGEYVIAVSRWAFLFKKHPFDFYHVNDNYRLIPLTMKHGGMDIYREFMSSEAPNWIGNPKQENSAFTKYEIELGPHTYNTRSWCQTNLFDSEFLNNDGQMPVKTPQDYFKDECFKEYPIQHTGFGSATRVAVDLAYFLKFKTCYIMSLDTVPVYGGWYSKHIEGVAISPSTIKPTTTYSQHPSKQNVWSPKVWSSRYGLYKGFNIRRVVPRDMYDIERKDVANKKRGVFKTVFYEDLVNDSPEVIDEIQYYDWVA